MALQKKTCYTFNGDDDNPLKIESVGTERGFNLFIDFYIPGLESSLRIIKQKKIRESFKINLFFY